MVALAVGAAGVASAQGSPDRARAQLLYEEGDRAELAGDCSTALKKFEDALTIVETPQLRLRAGRCQATLGKPLASLRSFERAVLLAKDDAELLALARPLVAGASARVPRIVLRVPSPAPAGLSVRIDGQPVADPGAPQPVEVGAHEIEAAGDGVTPFRRSLSVAEGASAEVTITLEPLAVQKPAPSGSRWGPTPWILIGASGGVLGASIGLGYASFDAKSRAYDELGPAVGCPGGVCTFAESEAPDSDAYRELESEIVAANGFLGASISLGVVAAGLAAAGAALAVSDDAEPSATAFPVVTPEGGRVVVVGSF